MSKVEVRSATVGNYENNVYVLVDEETKDSILIDTPFEPDVILGLTEGTNVRAIVFTHSDQDHLGAFDEVTKRLPVPIMAHAADADRIPRSCDRLIDEGDTVAFGNSSLRVLHTPGHTPGSICLVTDGLLISGDTLFPGGPGNAKRPGGDFEAIISGVRDKLFVLPDDTVVYPGHGKFTTIGDEKPHLQEWIDRGF
jgi:glyoxylase-like metal-dependent hydrolase (beta-lactamase superfamily II)